MTMPFNYNFNSKQVMRENFEEIMRIIKKRRGALEDFE